MTSTPDLEAWLPAIRSLAHRRARAWDVEAEDVAQTTALLALQRLSRGQEWWGWRTLDLCSLEAVRLVQAPESRAGRYARIPWDAVPARGGRELFELCSLPEPLELEDPDAETARHRLEWAQMGLKERQARIRESHRALGSSGLDSWP